MFASFGGVCSPTAADFKLPKMQFNNQLTIAVYLTTGFFKPGQASSSTQIPTAETEKSPKLPRVSK